MVLHNDHEGIISTRRPKRPRQSVKNRWLAADNDSDDEATYRKKRGRIESRKHVEECSNAQVAYKCGYCSEVRISSSNCTDGRVRIRCSCGGKHQDQKPRMHAKWFLVEDISDAVSTASSEGKPDSQLEDVQRPDEQMTEENEVQNAEEEVAESDDSVPVSPTCGSADDIRNEDLGEEAFTAGWSTSAWGDVDEDVFFLHMLTSDSTSLPQES